MWKSLLNKFTKKVGKGWIQLQKRFQPTLSCQIALNNWLSIIIPRAIKSSFGAGPSWRDWQYGFRISTWWLPSITYFINLKKSVLKKAYREGNGTRNNGWVGEWGLSVLMGWGSSQENRLPRMSFIVTSCVGALYKPRTLDPVDNVSVAEVGSHKASLC